MSAAYMAGTVVDAFSVTPHNSNTLSKVVNVLWVGGAGGGSLKVRLYPSGTTQTFTGVSAGWFQVQCDIVYSTDTDVTGIVGCVRG